MGGNFVNALFVILIIFSVAIVPVALFFWKPFDTFGGVHVFAMLVSLVSIFVIAKNKAIKKYFSESYEYLFIGIVLLGFVHMSELVFENMLKLDDLFDGKFMLFLEHIFFYLGVLSISYAFYKVKEPSIDEELLIEQESENNNL